MSKTSAKVLRALKYLSFSVGIVGAAILIACAIVVVAAVFLGEASACRLMKRSALLLFASAAR